MLPSVRRVVVFFTLFNACTAFAAVDLCITDVSAKECGVGNNEAFYGRYSYNGGGYLDIDTNRITVVDPGTGRDINVLNIPGRYRLTFGSVKIKRDLSYLVADMDLWLRVPGFPQDIQILNHDCDENSHPVRVPGASSSHFCRYCDLCELTERLEEDLRRKSVVAFNQDGAIDWGQSCEKLKACQEYTIARYINIPEPSQFEEKYGSDIQGLLRDALDTGEGKIIAKLRLLSLKSENGNTDQNCGTDREQKSCINDCLGRGHPPGYCLRQCQIKGTIDRRQEFTNVWRQEKPRCRASNGYLQNYDLAACYNIEFKFKATERPAGAASAVCNNRQSSSSNRATASCSDQEMSNCCGRTLWRPSGGQPPCRTQCLLACGGWT